jgi:hypothetical protein
MKRAVCFVAVMAALTMLAPVAAADQANWTVASRHTDFGTGNEPYPTAASNITVDGSGDTATLQLNAGDGFELEAADSGTPEDWSGTNPGNIQVQTGVVNSGQHAVQLDGTGIIERTTPASTGNISWSVYAADTSAESLARLYEDGTRVTIVGIRNDALVYFDGSYRTITNTVDAGEWVDITIHNVDPANDEFDVSFETASTSGTARNLAMDNAMSSHYDAVDLLETGSTGYFDDVDVADQPSSGQYTGDTHSVSSPAAAFVDISTLSDAEATISVENGVGTQIASQTVTSAGNHTVSLPGNNGAQEIAVALQATGANPTAEIEQEGVLIDPRAPSVDNLSPNTTSTTQGTSVTLEADVGDYDFRRVDEELTAEWYVDGSLRHTTTGITSNGTISHTLSSVSGGQHDWHVNVSDSYGEKTVSPTAEFLMPGELKVYNESRPSELLNGVELTIRFFNVSGQSEVIAERTVTDGTVDFTNLPANQRFTVTVEDSAENFTYRRIIVASLVDQQEIYLLPTTVPRAELVFRLNDKTGNFPAATTELRVQRPIRKDFDSDGSNETRYQTVVGDTFGASSEFPAVLVNDTRYLLEVRSPDGDVRTLGSYTVFGPAVVPLEVGSLSFETGGDSGVEYSASYTNTTGQPRIQFNYTDPEGDSDLRVVIYERNNQSNEIYNQSHSGVSTLGINQPLTTQQQNKTWVVEFNGTDGAAQIFGQIPVAKPGGIDIGLGPLWQQTIAVGSLLILAGLFGGVRAELGAVVTALLALGWWWVGWLPAEIGGGTLVLALAIAVLWRMSTTRGAPA